MSKIRFLIERGVCLGLVASLIAPTAVLAGDAVPGQTSSDQVGEKIKFSLDFDRGEIALQNYKLNLAVGAGSTNGKKASSVELDASKDYWLFGGEMEKDFSFGLGLQPKVRFRADGMSEQTVLKDQKLRMVDAEVGGATAMRFHAISRGNGEYITNAEGDREYVDGKPGGTFDARLLNASYVLSKNNQLDSHIKGTKLGILEMSAHRAIKVNGLPVDFCGSFGIFSIVDAKAKILGEKRGGGGSPNIEGNVCAGVKLGQIARAGYDWKGSITNLDNAHEAKSVQTVSLSNVANTGLGLSYANEKGHAERGHQEKPEGSNYSKYFKDAESNSETHMIRLEGKF